MTEISHKAKMVKRKETEIYKAKIAYYKLGKPLMSDEHYDAVERSLESLCPNHPILQMIGYDINDTYKKLSLKQTQELLDASESEEAK